MGQFIFDDGCSQPAQLGGSMSSGCEDLGFGFEVSRA